ncbi:MAG: hypothetical protein JWO58_677 [Chitinophagaceae bacterium]|nr:hypothetical protein [Chitinophagaceae bacterium]
MKTAIGYLFLSLAASLIGVVLIVVCYAVTGNLRALDMEANDQYHLLALCIYSVMHVGAIIPLAYFGFKWIRKEEKVSEKDARISEERREK